MEATSAGCRITIVPTPLRPVILSLFSPLKLLNCGGGSKPCSFLFFLFVIQAFFKCGFRHVRQNPQRAMPYLSSFTSCDDEAMVPVSAPVPASPPLSSIPLPSAFTSISNLNLPPLRRGSPPPGRAESIREKEKSPKGCTFGFSRASWGGTFGLAGEDSQGN